MEKEWNDLLKRSVADNPFLTHQWLHCWWRAFGKGLRLHIVLCRDDKAECRPLLAIFPGYITCGVFPPIRRLRLLGSEVVTSDFLDVILSGDSEKEILMELLSALHGDGNYQLAELSDLREESPLMTSIESAPSSGWQVQDWPVRKFCPYLILPESPAAYLSGLSRGVRKNFQYYRRRLEKKGAFLEIIQREEDLSQGINDFSRLHRSRRSQKGDSGIFFSKAQRNFYAAVFERFFRAGWLELAFLNVAGERVAGVCQFSYGNAVYYYQTGYDVSWEKSSVGFVLNGMLIERAIEQGKSYYEFLRGEERYKIRLGAVQKHQLRDLYLTRGNLYGELYLALRRLHRSVRSSAKTLLNPFLGGRMLDGKLTHDDG